MWSAADEERERRFRWRQNAVVIAVVLGVFTIVMLAISIVNVASNEVVVYKHEITGKLHADVLRPGIQTVPPRAHIHRWPATQIQSNHRISCVDASGVTTNLVVSLQFGITLSRIREAMVRYGNYDDYVIYLHSVQERAMHMACATYTTPSFVASRSGFELRLRDYVGDSMLNSTIGVLSQLQLQNIMLHPQYTAEVEKQQIAEQNVGIAFQMRNQSLIAARTELRQVNNTANIKLQQAAAVATGIDFESTQQAAANFTQYQMLADEYVSAMSNLQMNASEFVRLVLWSSLLERNNVRVSL